MTAEPEKSAPAARHSLNGPVSRALGAIGAAVLRCMPGPIRRKLETEAGMRFGRFVPVAIAEGLCNLALSIILVRKIGIIGVAWGTVIPNMATSIFFWPWYVRKTLGVPIGEYARKAWLLPTASLIPFAICSYLVGRFAPAPNLLIFFVQVAALLPVAAVGAWYIGLNRAERETYGPHLMTPLFRAVRRT